MVFANVQLVYYIKAHAYQVALQDLLLSQEHARNVIQIANNAVNK
jgi:hypothetical protein